MQKVLGSVTPSSVPLEDHKFKVILGYISGQGQPGLCENLLKQTETKQQKKKQRYKTCPDPQDPNFEDIARLKT